MTNGKIWSSQVPNEEVKNADSMGRAKGFKEAIRDGRSNKDVVGGKSQYFNGVDREVNGFCKPKSPDSVMAQRHPS